MPQLEYGTIAASIEKFIRKQVAEAGADGVVFGLSGGVDSAVTAYLCGRALGGNRCLALIMPNSEFTPTSETDDGLLVANSIQIQHKIIQVEPISKSVIGNDAMKLSFGGSQDLMNRVVGNLNARLRATLLYYEGQKLNYLVVGTDDRSEYMIGYFTKYGDGACDILPIVNLYKTEVWEMAKYLKVPQSIIDKEPSPHLWLGHRASDELGLDYAQIDSILRRICDDSAVISDVLGIRQDSVDRILKLHTSSEHKRRLPPMANALKGIQNGASQELPKPLKCIRPWGHFERFTLNKNSTVKMIRINPGASLSLQIHKKRSEFWKVISGDATAVIDGISVHLAKGDDLFVPAESAHRLTGGEENGAEILEIAIGNFSEDDIVRLEDRRGHR